jgi:hypothetical protein
MPIEFERHDIGGRESYRMWFNGSNYGRILYSPAGGNWISTLAPDASYETKEAAFEDACKGVGLDMESAEVISGGSRG